MQLHRPHNYYTTSDPYCQERVLTEPYTALHDPHTRRLMKQPFMRRHLCQQGLINEKSEVLCSYKEFNNYRRYLGTQYNDKVHDAISMTVSELDIS